MEHISIAAYDYSNRKLCDFYDSDVRTPGQAYNPVLVEELSGWKELTFILPFSADGAENFRWDYVKNEYMVRLRRGDNVDWFLLQTPQNTRNGQQITSTVKCPHISTMLKTKNLYLVFDDENGIGTINYLAGRALTNTGWTLGDVDTFYEADGTTEKVRSLLSDGKKGSYQLITDICNLFNAYPIYHGDTKTVDIHALAAKLPERELWVGKNLQTLNETNNSSTLITRLYVEGEYGDFGYVGIDDVEANTYGLSYIMNFDYFRSIGIFSPVHQAALNEYLDTTTGMPAKVAAIKAKATTIAQTQNELNALWGQIPYVVYELTNGSITTTILGGGATSDNATIVEGDEITILKTTGPYRVVTAGSGGSIAFTSDDKYAVKFVKLPSGSIGAKQVAIESKTQVKATLQTEYDNETDATKKASLAEQMATLQTEINSIYNTADTGLYDSMRTAVEKAVTLYGLEQDLATLQSEQLQIEETFDSAMGYLLRDGYWSDTNYAVGQEDSLYADALVMLEQLSKPQVTYQVSLAQFADLLGWTEQTPPLNTRVKILDDKLKINDVAHISKRTLYLDGTSVDTIELATTDVALTGRSFDSVLSRITQLADLLDQRETLYNRAEAITSSGSIYIDRLNGTLDVMRNQIASARSSWYSDEETGAWMFESVDGGSAMMLTGEGLMIANGKTGGQWNWRTAATGKGLVADVIYTGYLSADRIEAGSITVSKVTDDFGTILDISSNGSITSLVEGKTAVYTQWTDPANNYTVHNGDIWDKSSIYRQWGSVPYTSPTDLSNLNWSQASALPWQAYQGSQLYIRRNDQWVLSSDMALVVEQGTQIEQTKQQVSISAYEIETLNGELKKTQADFTVRADAITARVENDEGDIAQLNLNYNTLSTTVAGKANIYSQYTAPTGSTASPLKNGDIWNRTNHIQSWSDFSAKTWLQASQYTWSSLLGATTFVYNNGDWIVSSDMAAIAEQSTAIIQTQQQIGLMATKQEIQDGVPKVKTSTVLIDSEGIYMSTGGQVQITSGSRFRVVSGGKFEVFATDDASYIKFGGTDDNPNFSLGLGGTIKCKTLYVDDLAMQNGSMLSNGENSLAATVITSATQPTGHGIIWIRPNAVNSVDYNLTNSGGLDMGGGTAPQKDLPNFTINGSSLSGATCTYGVSFRIYNYSGTCTVSRIIVSIRRSGEDLSNAITIYDNQNVNQYLRVGDYINVNTLASPSGNLTNITDANQIVVNVKIIKNASTSSRFEPNELFILRCTNNSSMDAQLCEVKYLP